MDMWGVGPDGPVLVRAAARSPGAGPGRRRNWTRHTASVCFQFTHYGQALGVGPIRFDTDPAGAWLPARMESETGVARDGPARDVAPDRPGVIVGVT